jgi:sugar lactone lactonase YvrE
MKRNTIFFSISLIIIFSMVVGLTTSTAQAPQRPGQPEVTLGQPGTSFRYVKTYGTTEEPYLVDTTHLNRPHGLFMDSSNNLYVVEEQGHRILKYNPAGTNLLSIGKAGVGYTDNYVFSNPQDIALDAGGNIWVTDDTRIVQYSSAGTFLQNLPAEDPWARGNDETHFNGARGIAIDAANHWLFVSDERNQRIQVYDNSGSVPVYSATIGENGVPGNDDSHFNKPGRVALDSNHNLFVVDYGNNRVQKCVFGGTWTCSTFFGTLNQPQGIAIDGSNNVYIADMMNGRIQKCTPSANCSTFEQGAYWPYDVAVDSNGNVYGAVGNSESFVTKYDSSGTYLGAFVGVLSVPYLTDGNHFNQPSVAIDKDDNIIIIEENGQRLSKLNSQGVLQWSLGVPGVDGGDNTHFQWPHGVAVDKDGNIYVADDNRVQIFNPGGSYLYTIGGHFGSGNYDFQGADGIAVDNNGNIFVADSGNQRVQVYNSSRIYMATLGENGVPGSDNSHFRAPSGVEVDTAGNIYVADTNNGRVQKFNSSQVYQMTFADVSAEDVTVDAQGRVYVAGDIRVQVFDSNGAYLTTIGGASGNLSSQFRWVCGVAVDSQGNIYVSDFTNARIQVYAPGVPGWKQVNINGFGISDGWISALEIFNDQLFASSSNWRIGAQVWRMETDESWTAVSEPGFGSVYTNTNPAIPDMIVFNGNLYASTAWDGISGQVWRTPDGTTWNQVVSDGFGNTNSIGVTAFGTFDGMLYVGTFDAVDGTEIWRSATGDPDDWENVITGGKGNSNNKNTTSFIEYNGDFYVAIEGQSSAEIWRTEDGSIWSVVSEAGFGDPNNSGTGGMAIFGGYLYVGTHNIVTGAQLFRSADGLTWDPVRQDGFGDVNNFKIEMVYTSNGSLFAGTDNNLTGDEIWRSSDGLVWNQINPDGFGDSNNGGVVWNSSTLEFNHHLYIGTTNGVTGGEIWQYIGFPVYLPLVKR